MITKKLGAIFIVALSFLLQSCTNEECSDAKYYIYVTVNSKHHEEYCTNSYELLSPCGIEFTDIHGRHVKWENGQYDEYQITSK